VLLVGKGSSTSSAAPAGTPVISQAHVQTGERGDGNHGLSKGRDWHLASVMSENCQGVPGWWSELMEPSEQCNLARKLSTASERRRMG
jgi:hypothetical protein